MKEVWIGDKFFRDLRYVKIVDTKTHEIRWVLLTEKDAIKLAKRLKAVVRYSEDYFEKEVKNESERP